MFKSKIQNNVVKRSRILTPHYPITFKWQNTSVPPVATARKLRQKMPAVSCRKQWFSEAFVVFLAVKQLSNCMQVRIIVFQAFFWVQKARVLPIFMLSMRPSSICKTFSFVTVTMSNIKICHNCRILHEQFKKKRKSCNCTTLAIFWDLPGVRLFPPA